MTRTTKPKPATPPAFTAPAIPPADVLGLLDDYPTRSGFVITPVVVWAGAGARLRPDPRLQKMAG